MQNPYGGARVPAQTDNSTRRRTGHLHLNTSCETLAMPDTAPLTADLHRVEVHPPGTPFTGLGTLAVGVFTIAALYFGREAFVPMALALPDRQQRRVLPEMRRERPARCRGRVATAGR